MATRDQTRPRERSLHAAAEGSTIATTTQSSRQSCLPLSRSPPNPLQRHHGERCLVINIIVAINKTVTSLIRAISACAAIAGASNLAERNIYQSVDVLGCASSHYRRQSLVQRVQANRTSPRKRGIAPSLSLSAAPMELTKKIKIALDETRMLILGAQILLGFQFRGVFDNGFDQLPSNLRYLEGIALLPMICVIALLIAPGPYHRIVEGGEDSKYFLWLVSVIVNLALLPFAIALGLDVLVTSSRIFGNMAGAWAGIGLAAVALGFWYGLPHLRKRRNAKQEPVMAFRDTDTPSSTPLDVKIDQLLTEARVILPGAQALFGFQLAIVFTQSFGGLASVPMLVHAASLLLVALAVVLLMAPAAYHRIAYEGEVSADMHRVGSVLVTAATIPLALGLAGDTYVVIGKITASPAAAISAAGAAFTLLIGLWHAYPLIAASIRHRPR